MKSIEGPPFHRIDTSADYIASLVTTRGVVEFNLLTRECPRLVNNFIYLSTQGFYDGTIFHRVVEGFVIQGGDPLKTGEGGPGYFLPDELPTHPHKAGSLSMSNAGPDTNGSQFFIPLIEMPWLDEIYCTIGTFSSGEAALHAIKQGDVLERVRISERGRSTRANLTWSAIVDYWEEVAHKQKK